VSGGSAHATSRKRYKRTGIRGSFVHSVCLCRLEYRVVASSSVGNGAGILLQWQLAPPA